ncbi:DUF4333 domain-containing protein [Allonocardiopsis opalescens]|uniref:Uncharacterized protein DUF4333 n=1 Tax=Allonocardiopsis opalescens TaxID=1144618 RepID=A0A2T0Q7Q9_9ACTN|nr:DUF4333 domain-containing protein [Allonocardiopsis opalescens]PRX99887.1 uncharacterized protein DUF4333 [Allonocardiopsis opalescens]
METKTRLRAAVAAWALLGLGGLAGCAGAGGLPAAELAREVGSALAEQNGRPPDGVSCPRSLPARPGATAVCRVTWDGTAESVQATVVSVADGEVDELAVATIGRPSGAD